MDIASLKKAFIYVNWKRIGIFYLFAVFSLVGLPFLIALLIKIAAPQTFNAIFPRSYLEIDQTKTAMSGSTFTNPAAMFGSGFNIQPAPPNVIPNAQAILAGESTTGEKVLFAAFSSAAAAKNTHTTIGKAILSKKGGSSTATNGVITHSQDGKTTRIDQSGQFIVITEADSTESALDTLQRLPVISSVRQATFPTMFIVTILIYSLVQIFIIWPPIACWAATVNAKPGTSPIPAADLKQRLLSLNHPDLPFSVTEHTNKLIVEWKYADAKWLSLLSAGRIKRTHRLALRLDNRHIVTVCEQEQRLKWDFSIVPPRISSIFSYSIAFGINFFQYSAGIGYGLVFKEGRLTFDTLYQYRFSSQEMKQPIIETIINSGWHYQPVLYLGQPTLPIH